MENFKSKLLRNLYVPKHVLRRELGDPSAEGTMRTAQVNTLEISEPSKPVCLSVYGMKGNSQWTSKASDHWTLPRRQLLNAKQHAFLSKRVAELPTYPRPSSQQKKFDNFGELKKIMVWTLCEDLNFTGNCCFDDELHISLYEMCFLQINIILQSQTWILRKILSRSEVGCELSQSGIFARSVVVN